MPAAPLPPSRAPRRRKNSQMTDPRFFAPIGPLTLGALAERTGAEIARGDRGLPLDDVAPLETAGPRHVSFLDNRKYIEAFARSRAGGLSTPGRTIPAIRQTSLTPASGDHPWGCCARFRICR